MKGTIKRIENLSLDYKTFIGKEAEEYDLEICEWDLKENYKWTIASFDYDEEYHIYELNSCGNRLRSKKIDWEIFGLLVQKAYSILDNL